MIEEYMKIYQAMWNLVRANRIDKTLAQDLMHRLEATMTQEDLD
jgi:hypothetical protein